MTATSDDEPTYQSDLTDAVRDFLAEPTERNRSRIMGAMVHPLSKPEPEADKLEAILRAVLSGEHAVADPEETLQSVYWYDYQLRPTGRLRVVDEDWHNDADGDPGPTPPGGHARPPADEFDDLVAFQVRRLKINDEARRVYNAERSESSIPEPLDVAAVIRGEHEPLLPTMLTRSDGTSLLYPSLLHWLYGPPGTGKTMVAMFAAHQLIARGGHVAYFDWEGNAGVVGDRLRDMGADAAMVAKHLHYYRPGNLEPQGAWLAAGAENEWHLAIFDGTARALAASGRDEERNPEVLAWMEAVLTPLTDNGCAVLMLDHVTKDPEARGMPRGAGAKQGEVSGAAWELRAGQPFNRRSAGWVRLIQRKDREGRTGIDGDTVAELHVEPSRQGTRFTLRPPQKSAADHARAISMEKVWRHVNDLWAVQGETSTTKVWKIVGGMNRAHVGELLDELADLGHLRRTKGDRGAHVWEPVTPYLAPAMDLPPSPLTLPHEPWDVLGGE